MIAQQPLLMQPDVVTLAACRVVQTTSYRLVRQLVALWHSTLPVAPPGFRVAFVVVAGTTPIAVATWGRPVARLEDQETTLELTRQAHGPLAPRNMGTWFLARQRQWIRDNMPDVERLISYQDADRHDGALYKADNWCFVQETFKTTPWNKARPSRRAGTERQHRIKWVRTP